MSTVPYNYLNQAIRASCLIEPKDNDSFYNPTLMNHTGYAWDGTFYENGEQVSGPLYASWFNESSNPYRGDSTTFPQAGLVLLSHVALTILDETAAPLNLWMQFLLQNNMADPSGSPPVVAGSYALADNFNSELNGWLPSAVTYADGILSVTYSPDYGNQTGSVAGSPPTYNVDSNMIVNIDFTQDMVYLDVAV